MGTGGSCFTYDIVEFTVKLLTQLDFNTPGGGASSPGLDVRRC